MGRYLRIMIACVALLAVGLTPSPAAAVQPYDVQGGDPYYLAGSGAGCTIGFSVAGGYVTLGHCGDVGTQVLGYNQVPQGVVAGATFPGSDHAYVEVNDSWVPRPWIHRGGGDTLPVVGSEPAPIGATVCRTGLTTGWMCGTLIAKNVTVQFPEGTVTGLMEASFCSEPRDIGAPVVTPDGQAQGIVVGASGSCSSGGTSFIQPLLPILQAYGLQLLTAG
jgi:streptogrisin C